MEVVRWTARHMKEHGVESARLDAELLLSHTLNISRLDLYTGPDRPLTHTELGRFKNCVRDRLAGKSIAHIVGFGEFWKHRFEVTPGIFVPRPETEIIVERVLKLTESSGSFLLCDLCCGSGNIPVSVLADRPDGKGVGVDLSGDAVTAARKNAREAGIERERLDFVQKDADAFLDGVREHFDVITCNPPYIPSADIPGLPREVLEHEPREALDGGEDGLQLLRSIVPSCFEALLPGGHALFEYDGAHQTDALRTLLEQAGFSQCEVIRDLAGIDRIMVATRVS